MKKILFLVALTMVSICSSAQFVLTPSAGLMTENGPYVINRNGSESENYYAAKEAVEKTIHNVDIGELDYEKSFNALYIYQNRGKMPGALLATDWTIKFHLRIETSEGKIMISIEKAEELEYKRKGETLGYIYPTTGKNSMMNDMMGVHYIFNSKGEVAKSCKKLKAIYENVANDIVKQIENNL